jgi:5-methylcytosine-specific restriction endonuclease McrA
MKSGSQYDMYKVADNRWEVPCSKCCKIRIVNHFDNLHRTVKGNTTCRTCSQKGVIRKPLKTAFSKALLSSWSKEVRERDNNSCQVCGTTDNLHAHHIISKHFFPELAYNINNGVSLCSTCHYEYHFLNGK